MNARGSLCGFVVTLVSAACASGQQGPWAGSCRSTADNACLAAAAGVACPGLATGDPTSDGSWAPSLLSACCDPGLAYAMVEALYFGRDNQGSRQPIVLDLDRPGDENVILSTQSLSHPFEPGLRARLGYQLRNCHVIEAEYLGLFGARNHWRVTGDGSLAIPGDLGLSSNDFYDADDMDLTHKWGLHSGELNCVKRCECCCCDCCARLHRHWREWFVGLRYLSFDEEFNIRSTDLDEGTSDYNIRAHNDLFGVQIGGRWGRSRGRWGWELMGKAGLFGNACGQEQYVTDFPPPFFLRPRTGHDSGQLAFVGELGCSLRYQLTDVWAVRGGYNLMLIEGVALATDQLDFTNTDQSGSALAKDGGVFLHGVNVGLEARW